MYDATVIIHGLLQADTTFYSCQGEIPVNIKTLHVVWRDTRKSQWPSGPRRVLSSTTRTLGPRVRMPLGESISTYLFPEFTLPCMGKGLAIGRFSHKVSYQKKLQVVQDITMCRTQRQTWIFNITTVRSSNLAFLRNVYKKDHKPGKQMALSPIHL